MTRLLFLLAPFTLAACEDPVPSWFLEDPCPSGQYTLSNLTSETQTCTDLPASCSLDQFSRDGTITDACNDALCPDDLTTGIIVSDDSGEVTVDCEAPAA